MLTIFETSYWMVSHRKDSRHPGALIIASNINASNISALGVEALSELGAVLAKTERLLISFCNPYRVITAKLGFSAGHNCHFHMLPVSLDFLNEIIAHTDYTNEPDGNDALLYAGREYAERPLDKNELAKQLETVFMLREINLRSN